MNPDVMNVMIVGGFIGVILIYGSLNKGKSFWKEFF